MSLTAAMIRALGDEGLDVAAIARVAERLDAASALDLEAKRATKRAGNAERQRRFKANRKTKEVTPDNAGNAGNAGNAVTPSPNDIYSNPQPENPTNPSGLVTPKPKKVRLPDDWEPMPFKAGSAAALILIRWQPGRLERELAKFRAHYAAAGTRWENWQLVWAKWVNNAADFDRGNHDRPASQPASRNTAAFELAMRGVEPGATF